MNYIVNYSDVYFAILSVSTIAIAGLLVFIMMSVISILHDIKRISKLTRKEAEFIARSLEKGASILGTELSTEAAGFVRTVFTLLISQFGKAKTTSTKRTKIKSI